MVLPLMYDDLVEPVAAGEVVAFKAVLHENPAGKIAAQPAVAIHIDWFTAFQLRQPFAQFIQREVDRPLDMPSSVLRRGARIEQDDAAVARQGLNIVPMVLPHKAGTDVFDHIPAILTGSFAEEYGGA